MSRSPNGMRDPPAVDLRSGNTTIMETTNSMNADHRYHSHLFTLRLWIEPGMSHRDEVRFKVQHVLSGEVRYFREWSSLLEFMLIVFEDNEDDSLHYHCPSSSL